MQSVSKIITVPASPSIGFSLESIGSGIFLLNSRNPLAPCNGLEVELVNFSFVQRWLPIERQKAPDSLVKSFA